MTDSSAPAAANLPAWAQELSHKYYSRTFAVFVLHGNVHDLVPNGAGDYVPLGRFLNESLFARRELVLSYDRGGGIAFAKPDMQADFSAALGGYDSFHGTNYVRGLPRNPDAVLGLLDNYLRLRIQDHRKLALTIDFAETIAPAGDVSMMSAEDRNALVILKRWAQSPLLLQADVTICLIAENKSDLNPGLVQHPGVAALEVPLPDESDRAAFIRAELAARPLPAGSETGVDLLAKLTAGLKRIQIQSLIAAATESRQPLTMRVLLDRKKEVIEAECAGMLEFVQSRFNLSNVAGLTEAKTRLQNAVTAIHASRTEVLPMGYVVCGPVGTGKTFLVTCFAGEVGIPAVTLKNFRSMWQGVTEGNLERVLALLKAMSPIAVIVDEADAQLGDRSSDGDSGVSNRVFAQIAQFMGNTELRGKVVWFLLTCRPDLLPVDLKRQGRAEEHLALFYPESGEERRALLRAMLRKSGSKVAADDIEALFADTSLALSGADIEAILTRARMKSALEGDADVDAADVRAALEDFVPPSYPTEIELQTLVAVLECTSKSLLPVRFRNMDRAEIVRRVDALKSLVRD